MALYKSTQQGNTKLPDDKLFSPSPHRLSAFAVQMVFDLHLAAITGRPARRVKEVACQSECQSRTDAFLTPIDPILFTGYHCRVSVD